MSVRALSAVWEESRAEGSDLLVLLAMADWADHQGRCYPSYSQLATKSRVSRATAVMAVKRLESLGEIARVTRGHAPQTEDDDPSRVRTQARNAYQILLMRPKSKVVQSLDYLETSARSSDGERHDSAHVVQSSDHHDAPADRQVVQSTTPGGLMQTPQVVQSTDAHIRIRPSGRPSDRPSATAAAAAAASPAQAGPDEEQSVGVASLDRTPDLTAFVDAWNTAVAGHPVLKPVQALTLERRRLIRARLVDRPLADHQRAFATIARSAFCTGQGPQGFVLEFDTYLAKDDWAVKALEGRYDLLRKGRPPTTTAEKYAALEHATDVWGQILRQLASMISRHTFCQWFLDTTLVADHNTHLVIAADELCSRWIEKHFDETLRLAVNEVRPGARVEFQAPAAQRSA